jgi:hypothetical protein
LPDLDLGEIVEVYCADPNCVFTQSKRFLVDGKDTRSLSELDNFLKFKNVRSYSKSLVLGAENFHSISTLEAPNLKELELKRSNSFFKEDDLAPYGLFCLN